MSFDADSLGIRTTGLELMRDLVHERSGLYYDQTRLDGLADRLAPLVARHRFGSFLDYFYLLKYDAAAAAEWERVLDALSVPETYFWREIHQIQAAIDIVVPQLAARCGTRPLRIWSVPCASGEEPLTIAMLLEEQGWFDRASIELHAADASPSAIARATAGEYRERSFRALPPPLRERYFDAHGDVWRVKPALQQRVHAWHTLNLIDPAATAMMGGAPLIFCRNLFIYFSVAAIRQVVNALADHMPTPGYLCVAAAESLLRITNRFELEEIGGAFMYVKRNGGQKDVCR
jgi:chemotaxis protein methyltransferase CheR